MDDQIAGGRIAPDTRPARLLAARVGIENLAPDGERQ